MARCLLVRRWEPATHRGGGVSCLDRRGLFAGTAFAHDIDGVVGHGGGANANCVIPVGVTAGVIGQGGDLAQCNAIGGGNGYHD